MTTRCTIIAEAGVNHNGERDLALRLIDVAADAGADIIKFQSFKAAKLARRAAPKAAYQLAQTNQDESQFEMLKRLELSDALAEELIAHCRARGAVFLSTPFDVESMDALVGQGVDRIKVPSGEATNGPLLLHAARAGLPIILSTGMCTLDEIRAALGVIAFGMAQPDAAPSGEADITRAYEAARSNGTLAERVTLLHCTTEYPTPPEDVNLAAMATLRETFGCPVGFSDHSQGITAPIAAAALGATVIEKHFTLDRTMDGPDHAASLEPDELREMVAGVRLVERMRGDGLKAPSPSERKNIVIARKSLVAARPIASGEPFSLENLTAKRPGDGRSPMEIWSLLGQPAPRAYEEDEAIE